MLSLLSRAFEPSVPYPDKVTYMTSVNYLQSVRADNSAALVEKIKDLLTEKDTRLQGLQFLELALHQNPSIYLKGRWTSTLYDYIKEPVSSILKEHICKVLCLIIPCMVKDPAANNSEIQRCSTFLVPFLLSQVEKQVEWTESAALCLSACLKGFPMYLVSHKNRLIKILCHQISYSVSSRTFEVFAECFSLLPNCAPPSKEEDTFAHNWKEQYLMTLNSMHFILNRFISSVSDEDEDLGYRNEVISTAGDLPFDDDDEDDEEDNVYPSFTRNVRRFINLCKCLAKMLSMRISKQGVPVPIKLTLTYISRLFAIQEMCKTVPSLVEKQVILSNLAQMQIASMVLLESMSINLNIVSYSPFISRMMIFALQASTLPNIASESISPLRHAVWKFLDIWVGRHGAKVAPDILIDHPTIIEEVLKDIILEDSSQPQTSTPAAPKSKKNANVISARFVHRSQHSVCKAALKFLETILYVGTSFINKKTLQVIFHQLVQVACAISPGGEFPYPYDNDMCRKRLYLTLSALALTTKADQWEPIQCANALFKKALQDPSTKVVRQSHKLMAICRLYLYPRKPIPMMRDLEEKQRRVSNAAAKLTEWSTEDYVQDMTPVETPSVSSENQTPRITQTFHNPNEGEIASEEYMQVEAHYSEQIAESQCNGEDILEIQTSQCQDDVDSDEEDEEDDDEPSYGDEEMNQEVEMQEEPVYIPTKIQVLNPVHIASENEQNVEEREYEELRPCAKNEESNKNMHLNGVRNSNIVPDEEVQTETVQNVANENGLFGMEDEDLEEEEGEEDEEEESSGYPAEKRAPEFFETPSKMQKLDKEVSEEPQEEREGSRSPTLQEMKADFCCEIDDVKS